ncbi:hypothetical protein PHMEG_0006310 [Phytophthora megakarya]|uniref:BZIP domain-containing protein n=1 Tax=Phytophthora megakarya TaxID=4795 RepID=A0A225WP44_9STRA|nr:hypothetical protein PHMEG_0006310 [Phytophthora megakarya]
MDEDRAFLEEVTVFLTENNDQLDVSSLSTACNDDILDSCTLVSENAVLLPSSATQTNKKGIPCIPPEQRKEIRNAQAAVRRRKYREKVKSEKEALRHEEDALLLQLEKLQAASNRIDYAGMTVWRSIALRASWERMRAEEQYLQLHAAVTYRSRLIDQMTDLLRQLVTSPVDHLVTTVEVSGLNRKRDDVMLFHAFVSEIDTLYGQVDEVIPQTETKLSWPMEFKLTRKQSQGVDFFDSANATVIPFGFDEICRALSPLVLSGPRECRYTEGIWDPENIYASQHTLKFGMSINVYVATKRYQESSRLVFVWRSLYVGDTSFPGLQADEVGWLVVRPLSRVTTDPNSLSTFNSTILESYTRVIPTGNGETAYNGATADRFTTTIASAGEDEVSRVMRMLEEVLIQV